MLHGGIWFRSFININRMGSNEIVIQLLASTLLGASMDINACCDIKFGTKSHSVDLIMNFEVSVDKSSEMAQ